jgi:hypothetical protein
VPKNQMAIRRWAPASRSASAGWVTATSSFSGRPGTLRAGWPTNTFSGNARPIAVSAVGARSTSCR